MEPLPPAVESKSAVPSFSRASLAAVQQLNRHFLNTLILSSRHPAWCGSSWELALGPNLAEVLTVTQEVLCRSPVCLLDIGLGEEWPQEVLHGFYDTCPPSPPPFLARDRATQLAQTCLTLAWTASRNDHLSASIIFGLSKTRTKAIGALAVDAIPLISEKLSSLVRPRWLDAPRIWKFLLSSQTNPAVHLPEIQVRILQRQLADLYPATSASGISRNLRR